MTTLTQKEISNFWMRVCLGTTDVNVLKLAAVDRAYRDFNRTMHKIAKVQTDESYNSLRHFVSRITSEVCHLTLSQNTFDEWHLNKCNELKVEFLRVLNYNISYGQAQKWINMTLKYYFAIGSKTVKGIERNYKHFHIPVDNIIQDKLTEFNIPKLSQRWSRIDDYNVYIQYQMSVRKTFPGQIPMDVEFRLFNN